jgi:lysophospholipase L1-like esterase
MPKADAKQNSWATGDNPAVDSIYLRLLALNPAVRGHNANVAVDNTGVKELDGQADQALAVSPLPDLFLIETVDNDLRCDGTDADNIASFTATLEGVLRKISTGAPKATIMMVSSPWSTSQSYFNVAMQDPGARAANTGSGICDLFSPAGEPVPANLNTLEQITQQYLTAVQSACGQFPTCRYDNGALHRLEVTPDDVTPDGFHLTVAGQKKVAALEWSALAL